MAKRLLNFKVIAQVIGTLLIINGVLMSLALPFSFYHEDGTHWSIIIASFLTFGTGLALRLANKQSKDAEIRKRDGYLIVVLGWLSMAVFGTLPYLISGEIPNVSNAFFETMSGFTTTGASILGEEGHKISQLPESLLFWRSMTQWIGGMGIIVLTIAILPLLGIGGMELFVAEAPGPTKDKIHPRIKETAKRLWIIYLGLTLTETILLMISGLSFFDAINHALTTTSTGGFSTKDGSISEFNSASVEFIIIVFMFLAGTNFTLLYFGFKGKVKHILKNDEFKWYLMSIIGLTIVLTPFVAAHSDGGIIQGFRDTLFQVVSMITTTGYASADYMLWGSLVIFIFFLLLFSGASAGSTSGGMKIVRIVLLMKNGFMEFKRRLHPNAIIPVHLNKEPVSNKIIYNLLAFVFLYLFVFAMGSIIVTAMGVDFLEAISAVATSVGNVGPGIGDLGPSENFAGLPDPSKWVLSFLMLMGRLELFTVALIFTPYFWKRT